MEVEMEMEMERVGGEREREREDKKKERGWGAFHLSTHFFSLSFSFLLSLSNPSNPHPPNHRESTARGRCLPLAGLTRASLRLRGREKGGRGRERRIEREPFFLFEPFFPTFMAPPPPFPLAHIYISSVLFEARPFSDFVGGKNEN